jgi:hypothetical protein
MIDFKNAVIKKKFEQFPFKIRNRLLDLRKIIFEIAEQTPEIKDLEETLKWGEPSYKAINKVGSTVRLGFDKKTNCYAVYFNCKTTLVQTFKDLYGNLFKYGGQRSILFNLEENPPNEIRDCIRMALTYHLRK